MEKNIVVEFEKFCALNDIKREKTISNTQHQNSVIEWINKRIVE